MALQIACHVGTRWTQDIQQRTDGSQIKKEHQTFHPKTRIKQVL